MEPRITYMGQEINTRARVKRIVRTVNRWSKFKSWAHEEYIRANRMFKISGSIATLCLMSFYTGMASSQSEIAQADVMPVKVVNLQTLPPILERIAKAESGNSQYAKSGQVLIHSNKNGSVDVGKMQINSVWFETATKLGYDLTKEKDNIAFALWLFNNKGSEAWYSSKNNWK